MRQFHALAVVRKDDRMITDDITTTDRVNADLLRRAFAHDAFAPVARDFGKLLLANIRKNFRQRLRRAARRILLQAMMHLHDFEIVTQAKNLRRLARQPEQRVHAGGVIRRENHRDARCVVRDAGFLLIGMTGGADD